jgi:hypothetical protein
VPARFVLLGADRVSFRLGRWDRTRPLVIDPALVYSTLVGGSAIDDSRSIAVDGSGNAYITGRSASLNFPTTAGVFQPARSGPGDAFVTKLNATGSAVAYSTYLGGTGDESGDGIAVDGSGNAYLTGVTDSTNFPTTAGAPQITLGGSADAFVAKLDATGATLAFSTYLGGAQTDLPKDIAIDASGNAYVTGITSRDFPTTPGAFQPAPHPVPSGSASFQLDAFVTKVSSTGTALLYSTYLGGSYEDAGRAIAVDSAGNAYVTGSTRDPAGTSAADDFPTTAGAFQTSGGATNYDAFVTKLNPTGSALVYSTYLGGTTAPTANDDGEGIAVDAAGNAYVVGSTGSGNFPTTPGVVKTSLTGATHDGFVTKLNPTGSALAYSTYLGGVDFDAATGVALDTAGNAYVTGQTQSSDFPTNGGAPQPAYAGGGDAFATKLNATATAFAYSTYLGGDAVDAGSRIAVDSSGNAYVTGNSGATTTTKFPTTAGAFQATNVGSADAFVTKIATTTTDAVPPTTTIALSPSAPNGLNGWYVSPVHVTISATDNTGGLGVAETRCVLDPATTPATFADLPATPCPSLGPGADVTANGQHTVYAASRDTAGNMESPVVSKSFKIDQTSPTTVIATAPSGSAQHVTVSATDNAGGSGVDVTRCVLDPAAAPATFADLPTAPCPFLGAGGDVTTAGSHTIYAASRDLAGNVEGPPIVSATFTVTGGGGGGDLRARCQGKTWFLLNERGTIKVLVTDRSGNVVARLSERAQTSSGGSKSQPFTFSDSAGNTVSVRCHYLVVYRLRFLAPEAGQDFKAGSQIRVVFVLEDINHYRISDAEAQRLVNGCDAKVRLDNGGGQCARYDADANTFTRDIQTRAGTRAARITVEIFDGDVLLNRATRKIKLH